MSALSARAGTKSQKGNTPECVQSFVTGGTTLVSHLKTSIRGAMALSTLFLLAGPISVGSQEASPPKEIPRITWEETDYLGLLAKELELKTAGRIRLGKGIERKEVKVAVRDAGFYEVLDALCRAHKEVTYFIEDDVQPGTEQLTISPGRWIEYPASYHGHFKTALVAMMKTSRSSPEGNETRVETELVVFGPPWTALSWSSGAEVEWTINEARDAEGRDILAPPRIGPGDERMGISLDMHRSGNFSIHVVALRDFVLDRGLKVLAGKAKIRTVESRAVRLAAEAGATAEIPQGTLTVDSAKELEESGRESSWIIAVTLKPNESSKELNLHRVVGPRVRYDGDRGRGTYVSLPSQGRSFDVSTPPIPRSPK